MRCKHIFGVGALTAAALLGVGLTAHAEEPSPGNGRGNSSGEGIGGYQIVTQAFPTAPNGVPQTVLCPAHKKATGGGAVLPEGVLQGTYPTPDGRGWTGVGFSNGTGGMTVYAVCADIRRGV
ncbi:MULTISPECIES: hypothetical protein [unclassified Streptomyces]|uniref:hypothetical protein n=1 Tax=unclassified Streptomyces TaxID=2593676 RepID=UPI0038201C55